jgi:hypothetical protein
MNVLKAIVRSLGVTRELLSFFARTKRWWMLPVVLVVLCTALLTFVAQSSALAPLFYGLF